MTETTLARIRDIVGAAGIIDHAAEIEPFCRSWRDGWQGRVPMVVRPANVDQVAAVVRVCADTGTPIVPQGGNTGLTGASQPHDDMSEIILSTSRLTEVRDLDLAGDTITVEAGVVLAEIQRIAAANNRLFPLSLGAEGSCQIGGNIATNAGGTQVLRYGNTRNLVLGLEVVLPDGQIWNGLRALRKDNTGYDLKHLFIGGEGTLGVITAAVLKLFPRPTAAETAWIGLPDPAAAVRLLSVLRSHLGDSISAFELLQRRIIDLVVEHVDGHSQPLDPVPDWHVLVEASGFGGDGALSEPFANALGAAMEDGLLTDAIIASSGQQSKRFWQMREDTADAQKHGGVGIKHDVSVPVAKVPEFIARADAALEQAYPGIRLCAFGHVGDGNMHYNPLAPENWRGESFANERESVNRIVHDIVVELGGSISAEHGIGRLRLDENELYKHHIELDLMQKIKRVIDPDLVLNPGKVMRTATR
ncbi:MAG: FAD-binding oxidoreductase [Pseudomonadota bacterium]